MTGTTGSVESPQGHFTVDTPAPAETMVRELMDTVRKAAVVLFPGATSCWVVAEWPGGGRERRSKLLVPLIGSKPAGRDLTCREAILYLLQQRPVGQGYSGKQLISLTGFKGCYRVLSELQEEGLVFVGDSGYEIDRTKPS